MPIAFDSLVIDHIRCHLGEEVIHLLAEFIHLVVANSRVSLIKNPNEDLRCFLVCFEIACLSQASLLMTNDPLQFVDFLPVSPEIVLIAAQIAINSPELRIQHVYLPACNLYFLVVDCFQLGIHIALRSLKIPNFIVQISDSPFVFVTSILPLDPVLVSMQNIRSVQHLGQIVRLFFLSTRLCENSLNVLSMLAFRGQILTTNTDAFLQ